MTKNKQQRPNLRMPIESYKKLILCCGLVMEVMVYVAHAVCDIVTGFVAMCVYVLIGMTRICVRIYYEKLWWFDLKSQIISKL